jgi:hypothetical protein
LCFNPFKKPIDALARDYQQPQNPASENEQQEDTKGAPIKHKTIIQKVSFPYIAASVMAMPQMISPVETVRMSSLMSGLIGCSPV